jgi:hypothetical protein
VADQLDARRRTRRTSRTEPTVADRDHGGGGHAGDGVPRRRPPGSTRFIRLAAVSTALAGATTAKYQLVIDVAGKVSAINAFGDEDGVKGLTYTFDAVYDPTWAKFTTIGLQNKTATL